MVKEPVNKKLKISALIVNIIQVIVVILFEVFLYKLITFDNLFILEYIPLKKLLEVLIPAEIVLLALTIVPFFIKKTKKTTIVSIVISAVMVFALVASIILIFVYGDKIKNVFTRLDTTIDKVVENSKLSTDEYGVYVLKEDVAQEIKDISGYRLGYNSAYSKEDMDNVLSKVENELEEEALQVSYNDPAKLANALLNKDVGAIVLNQAMIDTIVSAGDDSDDGEDNGEFADFTDKIRCIYTVNIEKILAGMEDNGDVTKQCFNVYISGADNEGQVTTNSRSDVNIIMSVNPVTHQILLLSTPRDYYVPLSVSNGVKDKLTHAGNYGIDVSRETLEMLYDTQIDYYVKLNFTGFVNIIDALGGIDIESDYSFYTHGYSYSEGLNKNLSGIEALWFARERHAFAEGDRQRGKHQMKVIESVIDKCQSTALLHNYDAIMSQVSESFLTNMSKKNIKALVNLQLEESPKWKIISYSVSGQGSSEYTYSIPSQRAYVMFPDENNIATAQKLLTDMKENKKIKEPKSTEE